MNASTPMGVGFSRLLGSAISMGVGEGALDLFSILSFPKLTSTFEAHQMKEPNNWKKKCSPALELLVLQRVSV